jgi:hypothetical protein
MGSRLSQGGERGTPSKALRKKTLNLTFLPRDFHPVATMPRELARIQSVFMIVQETGDPRLQ